MYNLQQNEIESYTVWTVVGALSIIIFIILYAVFKHYICTGHTEEEQNPQLAPIAPLNVIA